MKTRDISFDIARSLAVLWVIAVWHLFVYDSNLDIYTPVGQSVTNIFMSVFMFISGYMLGKYSFSSWNEVTTFYKKRFFRFWILYFISAVSIFIVCAYTGNPMISSKQQLILSILGLTTLIPPHPGTLWFMSMLMMFYVLTPLLSCSQKLYKRIAVAIAIMVFFGLWQIATGNIDKMVYCYFPIYVVGLLVPHNIVEKLKARPVVSFFCCGLASAGIWLSLLYDNAAYRIVFGILFGLFGTMAVIGISDLMSKVKSTAFQKFFAWIAYASMCAYLFHRHLFSILHTICNHMHIGINLPVMWLIFVPCTLIVAYIIQKIYDSLLNKVVKQ